MLKLIKPELKHKSKIIEMLDEWKKDIEENNTNHSPWSIFKNDPSDFEYYIQNLDIKQGNEKLVSDETLFLYDDESNEFIGACNIRHYLNDYLLKYGGHIGDGIRPSKRKQGYGTILVSLALERCKELKIEKVLMTCDKDNIGSKKTILNNGGILENEILDQDSNKIVQRYWINIEK